MSVVSIIGLIFGLLIVLASIDSVTKAVAPAWVIFVVGLVLAIGSALRG